MRPAAKRLVGVLSIVVAASFAVGAGVAPATAKDPTFPTWADVLIAIRARPHSSPRTAHFFKEIR